LRRYLLIAFGGALGAMLRYFVGRVAAERFGPRFPVGTLTINVSACFMIGFILEYLNHHGGLNPAWRYGFAIGFIGAFSTFSTFEWEIWSDLTHGAFWLGILYMAVSLIAGFIAVALGSLAARSLS
jgi:fluoride exporter